MNSKERCLKILEELQRVWPATSCDLKYSSPFQLLVASVLAARTRDEVVNRILPHLMSAYPDASSLAHSVSLLPMIQNVTYPENKAVYLKELSTVLVEHYQGEVPRSVEQLEKLPGVGRKSACLVCVEAFGIPAIPVDTHVKRVCNRTHICVQPDVRMIEHQLMMYLPRETWKDSYRRLVRLGKTYCLAAQPDCEACPIKPWCATASPSPQAIQLSFF